MIKMAVQVVAIIVVSAGMAFEVMADAHIGFILITGGALAFAISTKIKEVQRNGQVQDKQRGKFQEDEKAKEEKELPPQEVGQDRCST